MDQKTVERIEAEEEVLDALRNMILSCGASSFVGHAILTLDEQFFPDVWRGDLHSIRRLTIRLLTYAGLGDRVVRIVSFEDMSASDFHSEVSRLRSERMPSDSALFLGVDDDGCLVFGVDPAAVSDSELLLAALTREVASAFRDACGLCHPDPVSEEQLVDLTTVYLGFGAITTKLSSRHRQWGSLSGRSIKTHMATRYLGALPTIDMVFALAAQTVVRDCSSDTRRRIERDLETNQRHMFRAARRRLRRDRGSLYRSLGLSEEVVRSMGAESLQHHLPPMQADQERTTDSATPPNSGQPIFRRRVDSEMLWSIALAALGGLLGAQFHQVPPIVIGVIVGAIVGRIAGRESVRFYCSAPACAQKIPKQAATCPRCGGFVAGTIAQDESHFDAQELYFDAHRRDPANNGHSQVASRLGYQRKTANAVD